MSFWPFGQSLNSSNINRILDDYFNVLHTLEKTNPTVAKCVHQNFAENGSLSTSSLDIDGRDIVPAADISGGFANNMDTGRRMHGGELSGRFDDSTISMGQRSINSAGSHSSTDSGSSNARSSSFTSGSESSRTDSDEDDINSATEPLAMSIKNLNSSFIDKLLEESELLNELTRQNSTLLDFICFGFFYDSNARAIVPNIDYLIELMIKCIDNVNSSSEEKNEEHSSLITKEDDSNIENQQLENSDRVTNKNNNMMTNEEKNRKQNHDDNYDDDDNNNNNVANDDENIGSDENKRFVESISASMLEQGGSNSLNKATIISEIFSLDIWLISESLVKNQKYLQKIWSILQNPKLDSERSPLVPIFLKINQNLLVTRQDQYLNFIRTKKTLVNDMLNHVSISLLMDFFLKCMATDKVEAPTGIIELVHDQDLIPKCLKFLDNELYAPDVQACAGDFLKALIAISANAPLDDMSIGPNCLTRQLVSPEVIKDLVQTIIKKRGSALNITVSIVIELIRKNNSDYDQVNLLDTTIQSHPPSNRDPIYLGYMLKEFAMNLPYLFHIILDRENCDEDDMLENQLKERYKPLGFERFKVVELVAELLHCSNMGLMNSKKAERINRERDKCRKQLTLQLRDALEELTVDDDSNSKTNGMSRRNTSVLSFQTRNNFSNNDHDDHNNDDTADDNKYDDKHDDNNYNAENAKISLSTHTLDMKDTSSMDAHNKSHTKNGSGSNYESSDDEIDESFEIPYVNTNQNAKLRKSPTIGDLFKIKLYDTQILPKIAELFLSHPWNNFWHNVIFDIIQQIFNGRMDFSYNSFLVYSLFNLEGSFRFMYDDESDNVVMKDFVLTNDFILKGYKDSYAFYENKHTNLGYMGHLVLIAEEVVKFSRLYKVELISPDIHDTLKNEEWVFYTENVLNDTRLMYSKILGGGNYIDDGNGNIIPQMNDNTNEEGVTDTNRGEEVSGGNLINVETLEEQLCLSTESDLHEKLRALLIHNAEKDVAEKNKQNGVIILGPPPEETVAINPPEATEEVN